MEWTWIDFSTYVYQNLDTGLAVAAIGLFLTFVVTFIVGAYSDLALHGNFKKHMAITAIILSVFTVLAAFIVIFAPTHDKILQVKISKIKNEAVTKENLEKGVNVIERIGRKLECKYLECNSDKEISNGTGN